MATTIAKFQLFADIFSLTVPITTVQNGQEQATTTIIIIITIINCWVSTVIVVLFNLCSANRLISEY